MTPIGIGCIQYCIRLHQPNTIQCPWYICARINFGGVSETTPTTPTRLYLHADLA